MPVNARYALVTVSHDAQLVVVGSRRQAGVAGLRIISISRYPLHHSTCPVAVIRSQPAVIAQRS
jgi:nucleotide-binding universal stress UspA family protein